MKYQFKYKMKTFHIILLFIIFVAAWYYLSLKYEQYLENEPTILRLKNKLYPVFPELKYVKIMKGGSSYILNKKKIYLCTESKGIVYDDNMLTYVILHELAHSMCPQLNHTKQFKEIFDVLLKRAIRHKLYDPTKPKPENYCEN